MEAHETRVRRVSETVVDSVTCDNKHHCIRYHRTRLRAVLPGDWRRGCGSPVTAGQRGRTGQGDVSLGNSPAAAPAVSTASSWHHCSRSDQGRACAARQHTRCRLVAQSHSSSSSGFSLHSVVRIPVARPWLLSHVTSGHSLPCLCSTLALTLGPFLSLHFSGFSLNVTT